MNGKMKIITIKGGKNSGKTTTIRNIYQKLTVMKNSKILEFTPAGFDKTDFDAVVSVGNTIVVIRSYGDGISYVRTGLKYAESKNASLFINAWNSDLDKDYDIKIELPDTKIHENPVQICEPLRNQWMNFSNHIAFEIIGISG